MATKEFIQERINATQQQIINVETAIGEILSDGVSMFSLDTGQTKETVTKIDLARLNGLLEVLEERLANYELKLCGGGARIGSVLG